MYTEALHLLACMKQAGKKPFLSPDGEMKTLEATFSGSHLFSTVLTRYGSFFSDQNVKKEQAKAAESLCCLSDISLLK